MKKWLIASFVALFALGAGVSIASAHGFGFKGQPAGQGFEQMLQYKAEILGLSADQLKQELDSGKNFLQIAEEHGISQEQLHQRMTEAMKVRLQAMVSAGTITQAQMEQRLEWMERRAENPPHNFAPGFGFHARMHRAQ